MPCRLVLLSNIICSYACRSSAKAGDKLLFFQEKKHCDSIPINSVGFKCNLCIAPFLFHSYLSLLSTSSVTLYPSNAVPLFSCLKIHLRQRHIEQKVNFQALVWKDRGPRGHIIFLACLCMFKNCLTYKYLLSSFLLHCALHSLWICPYLSFFILHDGAPGSVRIDLFNVPQVFLLPVQLKMATVCRTTKNQTKPNQNKTNLAKTDQNKQKNST